MNIKSIKARIISAVMALIMIPQIGFAFPSDVDDVPIKDIMAEESSAGIFSEDNVYNAFKLLKYIGAISDEETAFEENKPVSRAYAAAAFGAIASGGTADTKIADFTDVPESNQYASGIQQAANHGILDTDTDKFYPNKNVSAEDIAKWAIRVLKQDYVIYNQSMFSSAEELGIFKGVKYSSDEITMGQFMLILENVLNSDFIKMTGVDASGNCVFTVSEDESFLNKTYDIYLQEGILTGYRYSSIYGDLDLTPDKVQINRANFYVDNAISMDYVGSYVNAYVDKEDENKIVSLWQNAKKTNTYTASKEDFKEFTPTEISYLNGSSLKKLKINEQVPFLYNNVYYGNYNREVADNILPSCDRFIVIDNDGDGRGDLVKCEKYTHYLVKNVSVMTETIVFKNGGGTLKTDDSSTVDFYFNSQRVESIGSLKADDVLTVLEAYRIDKSRVFEAIVTRDMAEGKISSKSEDEKGEYYIIDADKYYLCDEYIKYYETNSSEQKPKAGSYVQLYIGYDGMVVAAKTESDFSYGFVMSSAYDESEEYARVKLYTLDGSVKNYNFDEKVKVYNAENIEGRKLDMAQAYNLVSDSGKMTNDVIAYTVNADGLITSIALPIDRTAYAHGSLYYPLTLDYNGTGQNPRMYRNVFEQRYKMDNSVQIMVRPAESSLLGDEKAYEMRTGNYWSVEHYFSGENIKLYNCDKFYVPDFCVMEGTSSKDLSQGEGRVHMYCIAGVESTVDEDDMPVKKISYYENGKITSAPIAEEVDFVDSGAYCDVDTVEELKKGDIIQFDKNSLGKINIIRVLFSIQNRPMEFGAYYTVKTETNSSGEVIRKWIEPSENALGGMPSINVIYAKVEDISGNIALINTSKSGTDPKHIYPITIGHSVYGSVYYNIYDSKNKEVTAGSLSEIQTGDIVVMRRYYNHVQDVVIIR